jgi:hypothetical protein
MPQMQRERCTEDCVEQCATHAHRVLRRWRMEHRHLGDRMIARIGMKGRQGEAVNTLPFVTF